MVYPYSIYVCGIYDYRKEDVKTWSGIKNYNKNIMIDDSIAINVTFISVNSAR